MSAPQSFGSRPKQPLPSVQLFELTIRSATVATAHRHHIEIPEELTVCGIDDTLLATTIWPEITTIHQPITTMSQTAIDLLEKRIRALRDGRDPDQDDVTLEFRFVRRGSDAPPPDQA